MGSENIKRASNFDELLDLKYGKIGTYERTKFENEAKQFLVISVYKKKNH